MLSLYELKNSDDFRILNGLEMDLITKDTMKALDLHFFRSTKNRDVDREKALALYSDKVDLSLYAIHHCFNGLVGLAPREFHSQVAHYGYFYRLTA